MRETLREELRPQPRFAKVQFVLADQTSGVAVEQRQAGISASGGAPLSPTTSAKKLVY